jgi:hypothetical protein
LHVRGLGNSAATTANWLVNYAISATFLTASKTLGRPIVFGFFGLCCFVGAAWLFRALPETNGKTLEEVELLFKCPGDDEVEPFRSGGGGVGGVSSDGGDGEGGTGSVGGTSSNVQRGAGGRAVRRSGGGVYAKPGDSTDTRLLPGGGRSGGKGGYRGVVDNNEVEQGSPASLTSPLVAN